VSDFIQISAGKERSFFTKAAHWLDFHGVLDLHQHPRANEDLTRLCLIAQPRGDVGHNTNCRVVEASFKTNSAERSKAVCNADTEANVVPEPTPPIGKFKFREAEAGRDLSA
jgi:hypothetical protein